MATKDEALGLPEGTSDVKPSLDNRYAVHAHFLYQLLAHNAEARLAAERLLAQNLEHLTNATHSHYCEVLLQEIRAGQLPSTLLE